MIGSKPESVPKHKQFELQIHRIIQVLEGDGAVVKWDDKIPDPHVPGHTRQIDITIRRGGWVTFVECRDHKTPQDVTWIEELYGRKNLIGANAIMAVSSSGFTSTAKIYAERFGIFLRELNKINDDEVTSWGKTSVFSFSYFSFSGLKLVIQGWQPENDPKLTDSTGKELAIYELFHPIVERLKKTKWEKSKEFQIKLGPFYINGHRIEIGTLVGKVKKQDERKPLATVLEFLDSSSGKNISSVERFGDGSNEIVRSSDKNGLIVDLGSLKLPSNSIIDSVKFDMGEPTIVNGYQMIGANRYVSEKFGLEVQLIS